MPVNSSTAPEPDNLALVWQWLVTRLSEAPGDRDCPLRLMTLSSVDGEARPQARHVILRAFDATAIVASFYSDARSGKVVELKGRPDVALTFYDPAAEVQIRAQARASRRWDPESRASAWHNLPATSRLSYATRQAPGSAISAPFTVGRDTVDSEQAYRRFAIIDCEISEVDYLHLHHGGHRRAGFSRGDHWQGSWRVP